MDRRWLFAGMLWLPTSVWALTDLGTFGPTWPIAETSLLQIIQQKLKTLENNGQLSAHQHRIQTRTLHGLQRPPSVMTVGSTTQPRRFDYDPTYTLSQDLNDHQGRRIHTKGTCINPLKYHSLSQPLLFINGDDPIQKEWALSQRPAKIILTQGFPFEWMKTLDQPVYFDQQGALVEQLGIQQIPARVTQRNDRLHIEELIL